MSGLNNIEINKLPEVLKKETLPESYWNLTENAEANCNKLCSAGIKCSDDLFELIKYSGKISMLIKETGISKNYLYSLNGILSFHRFKPIPLKKIEDINPLYIKKLEDAGIKNTETLLLAGKTKKYREKLADDLKIHVKEIDRFITASDLMRKPGIKSTKVKLFMAVGITSLNSLGKQNPKKFRQALEKFILKTGIVKAVPAPKEVESDIKWAGLYPQIIKFS